ncbi:hypothetical protein SAMN04487916_10938 [Arthrobacter sp. ov407]|nr:hypothetical protein SAMN04487916_10938 [Arthrobacter sp. ov407]
MTRSTIPNHGLQLCNIGIIRYPVVFPAATARPAIFPSDTAGVHITA